MGVSHCDERANEANGVVREQAQAGWALILTIWFFGVLAGAGLGKTIPLVGMVIKLYGAPPSQTPWFISIVTVASVVLAPFGGWLIDRFGERRILALSCLIDILGNLVVAAAGSFAAVMAGRLIEGFGYTGLLVAGTAMMVRVTRGAQRNIAMTLWGTSVPIGVGVAEALSSTLTDGVFQRPFWGHAAALIIGLALVGALPRSSRAVSAHDAFGMFEIYRHPGCSSAGRGADGGGRRSIRHRRDIPAVPENRVRATDRNRGTDRRREHCARGAGQHRRGMLLNKNGNVAEQENVAADARVDRRRIGGGRRRPDLRAEHRRGPQLPDVPSVLHRRRRRHRPGVRDGAGDRAKPGSLWGSRGPLQSTG